MLETEAFHSAEERLFLRTVQVWPRKPPRWLGVTVMAAAFALVSLILIGIASS